jgi:hypothetical protein
MTELWRHMLDLSVELAKLDEAGNYRGPRQAQKLPHSARQSRSLVQDREQLGRELELLPAAPEFLQPEPEAIPVSSREYRHYPPRLPPQHVRPIRQHYPAPIHHIDAVPPWNSQPRRNLGSEARKWNDTALASFVGALFGIVGYVFIFGAQDKIGGVMAPSPVPDIVKSGDSRSSVSDHVSFAPSPKPADPENVSQSQAIVQPVAAPPTDYELLQRASIKLTGGDLAGARSIYETLAQRGSGLGAFGLAETYDPNVPRHRRMPGFKPDPKLARYWYERAASLGEAEASKRLQQLKPPKTQSSSASEVLRH